MRIAPLGALYRDDPARLAQVAVESSLCTHGDIRAAAFAYAVAHAAADFVMGKTVEEIKAGLPAAVAARETEWLDGHAEWAIDRSAGHLISRCLEEFFTAMPEEPEQLRARISALARPYLAKGFTRAHPSQGFVLLGGLHGLAMALLKNDDAPAILSEVARQGFDTDTVAAITGGLLGARLGTGWIPLERLRDRARIEGYADALVERGAPVEDLDSFARRETEWTRVEIDYQKSMIETAF
jgi:ADP-ribosylglycohydrolase